MLCVGVESKDGGRGSSRFGMVMDDAPMMGGQGSAKHLLLWR